MAQFNEANSVRDFVRDLVKSIDVQFVPGNELPRRTDEVMLEGAGQGCADPAEPGDRGRPGQGRRGHLQPARDPDRRPDQPASGGGERGVHGVADRAEVDAVRPERRAHDGPADRLR